MEVIVEPVTAPRARKEFLDLPRRIYGHDPCWVPPLRAEMRRILDPRRNSHLRKGPCCLFLARRGPLAVGRVAAGIDEPLNRLKGRRRGWFALFECVDDREAARALLDAAEAFLSGHGCTEMHGPVSPTGGDDYRGLLVEGFDSPPVLMNSYNPPYYRSLLEDCRLEKELDLYAYRFDYRPPKHQEAVDYALRRYGFRLDRLDLRRLDREISDIKRIIDRAMPAEWPDLGPPPLEELREMAGTLRTVADPDLIYIARAGEEPIGFNLALPDLNQALIHLNGRLFPFGWLKFLYYRRRIEALRFFVLFVVPEWRRKGVSAAIFQQLYATAAQKGIRWAEGSTIGEDNLPMRRDVERAGGLHYKTYRLYRRAIPSMELAQG